MFPVYAEGRIKCAARSTQRHSRASPSTFSLSCVDYNNKVKVDLTNMDDSAIVKKVEEAIETGNEMPRSYWQSVATNLQPSVIE